MSQPTHIATLVKALREERGALPPAVREALDALEACPSCAQASEGAFTFSPTFTLEKLAEHARARGINGLIVDNGDSVLVVSVEDDAKGVLRSLFLEDDADASGEIV